jgi:E3 ubiquitin-protein ligase HERC2
VDDCGGGYSESITEMCDELQNGSLPLLIPTPNGRDDAGTNRDCFLFSPMAKSPLHMNMFRFLGNAITFILRFLGKAGTFVLRFLDKVMVSYWGF